MDNLETSFTSYLSFSFMLLITVKSPALVPYNRCFNWFTENSPATTCRHFLMDYMKTQST